jgi:hypothetical protein
MLNIDDKYDCDKSLINQKGLIKKKGAPEPRWRILILETCNEIMDVDAM